MKKSSKRKNKSNKKLILLMVLVLFVGIGFAALQKYIRINGSASIDSNFDVKISNITQQEVIGEAYERQVATYTDMTATFDVGLIQPGDSVTYNIEISNLGNSKAKLDDIVISETGSENISYEISGLEIGDVLNLSEKSNLLVKVTYVGNVSEKLSKALTLTLSFVQTTEDKTYSIGEEIVLGSEEFYVISDNGDTISALAKYNLLVGEEYTCEEKDPETGTTSCSVRTISETEEGYGLQNENALGTLDYNETTSALGVVSFRGDEINSNGEYEYDENKLVSYLNNYETYLNNLEGISSVNVEFLTKSQATEFGCERNSCIESSCSWIYGTSYWLSNVDITDGFIPAIYITGEFANVSWNSNSFGIRPVITISKSEL